MKIKILLAIAFAVLLSGCVGTPDSEGWRYGQKSEFLKILETDKYASIAWVRASTPVSAVIWGGRDKVREGSNIMAFGNSFGSMAYDFRWSS